jgi:hypothetical protein
MWIEQSKLSPANLRALDVYGSLAKRVVVDFHLEPLVFDALSLHLTSDDARLLVELLDVIHAEKNPPAKHG